MSDRVNKQFLKHIILSILLTTTFFVLTISCVKEVAVEPTTTIKRSSNATFVPFDIGPAPEPIVNNPTETQKANIIYSTIRKNHLCIGNLDDRQILWNSKIIELKDGVMKNTEGKNTASCIDHSLEPKVITIIGDCNSQGRVNFPQNELDKCKDFSPITYNCQIYSEDFNFTIDQTNLAHFSKNIDGIHTSLYFEVSSSDYSNSSYHQIGSNEFSTVISNNELKKQIQSQEILNNPFAMGFAACQYFAFRNGATGFTPRFDQDNCLWKNPNAKECYGKFDPTLWENEFYHPTYYGDYSKSLPGYQGDLTFNFGRSYVEENLNDDMTPIDENDDGWATFEITPINTFGNGYPHNFAIRASVPIPYNKNNQFNNLMNLPDSTRQTQLLKTTEKFQRAYETLSCIHRSHENCPPELNSPMIYYKNTIKRDFLGYGGAHRVPKIRRYQDSEKNIINRSNLCREDNPNSLGGCKNLIITDFETCDREYINKIPSNTEIACLPKHLEIFNNQISDENQELDIFTIAGFDTVQIKNLAIKIIPNGIRGQVWKSNRILETLEYADGVFSCSPKFDDQTDPRYQGTGNCFNAQEFCASLTNINLSKDEIINSCKDAISREILRSIAFRNQDNDTQTIFGKYNYFGDYGVIKNDNRYSLNSEFKTLLDQAKILNGRYLNSENKISTVDQMLLNNITGILGPNFESYSLVSKPILNLFSMKEVSLLTKENLTELKCGDDTISKNDLLDLTNLETVLNKENTNPVLVLEQFQKNCPESFFYTILRLLADTFSPQKNIYTFYSIFKIVDNSNVTISNVITRSSTKDAHIYALAVQKLSVNGVKIEGISGEELRDHHIPLDDPDLGLKRIVGDPWKSQLPLDIGHLFPGRYLETLFFMGNGIKVENGRNFDGTGIEYPNSADRLLDSDYPDDFLPSANICISQNGSNVIDSCQNKVYRENLTITNKQLLSPFYESNFGPEKNMSTNASFNYFDGSTHFNTLRFQNRSFCSYQEAKNLSPFPQYISGDNYSAYFPLNACTKNSDCASIGGGDGVCLYGTCRTSACDNDFTVITNSTIQNDTYNTNYVDDLLDGPKFLNPAWDMNYSNTDGIIFQSTSGFIFNNNVRNIMGDTLYDLQHRDWSNRSPASFDHVRVERNLFSLGMTKNSSPGSPEDTTVYSNNLYVSTNVGGYWQNYRPFWIHNTFIQPDKVEHAISSEFSNQDLPDSYAKATYRMFHLLDTNRSFNSSNAPYSGIRMNIFNNSVISATDRQGYLFLDKNDNAIPSGLRFTSSGNLFLPSILTIGRTNESRNSISMSSDELPENYSSRTDFIAQYCYGTTVTNIFDHIKETDACQQKSIAGGCMEGDKGFDHRCFFGGHENYVEVIGELFFPLFNKIDFFDLNTAEKLISASDPFSKLYNQHQKCSQYPKISETHRNVKASSFQTMDYRYRVHRDFYGHNRYVKTTPGAFEAVGLDSNGCNP